MDLSNYRKVIVALVGAVATAVSLGLVPEQVGDWLAVATAFLTALGVYAVENESGQPLLGRNRNQQTLDDMRGRLEPYDPEHTTPAPDQGAVSWGTVALLVIAAVLVLWALGEVPR